MINCKVFVYVQSWFITAGTYGVSRLLDDDALNQSSLVVQKKETSKKIFYTPHKYENRLDLQL